MEPKALFIGPYDVGIQRNLKPFMLPDQAFPTLTNATIFRGRVQRKTGHRLIGRLRRVLTTVSIGNISSATTTLNLFTAMGLNVLQPNAQMEPGNLTTITITIGAPISTTLTDTTGTGTLTSNTGNITAATINYATGVLSLTFSGVFGASAATITGAYYPTLPVMGLRTRELTTINSEQTVAFDTIYSYRFSGNVWSLLPSTLAVTWSGTNYQMFWTTNYYQDSANNNLFWATNGVIGIHGFAVTLFANAVAGPPSTIDVTAAGNTFQAGDVVYFVNLAGAGAANNLLTGTVTIAGNPTFTISNPGTNVFTNGIVTGLVLSSTVNTNGDGIRYYNGTTWKNFNPPVNGTTVIMGALMIVPYHGRLVLLNTSEGNSLVPAATSYKQRARWSQIGSPISDFMLAWRDDLVGYGSYDDAATSEQIVSCGFIKDQLVVYFERSTWVLQYTGNQLQPFQWQKINTELGCESTFSTVPFDNGVVAIGNVGVHTCNAVSVMRIDELIPDEIFRIQNASNGPQRVYGIRDYFKEFVYFTFPEVDNLPTFPNKVLVYNYRNNTWSFFNESFTCYGYWQQATNYTWSQLTASGPYPTWSVWNAPWNSGSNQSDFLDIAAGNQQGFVLQLIPDSTSNANTRTISAISSNLLTSPNHNLFLGDFILISGCLGSTNLNDTIFQVLSIPTASTFTISTSASGTYIGSGVFKVLSNVNIKTKMFNPFWDTATRFQLLKAEYLFDRTSDGEVSVDIFVDTSSSGSLSDPNGSEVAPDTILGTNVVFTKPETQLQLQQQNQNVIWHRQYNYIDGETFQVVISLSDAQMADLTINESDIVLHGMILHFTTSGEFQ